MFQNILLSLTFIENEDDAELLHIDIEGDSGVYTVYCTA